MMARREVGHKGHATDFGVMCPLPCPPLTGSSVSGCRAPIGTGPGVSQMKCISAEDLNQATCAERLHARVVERAYLREYDLDFDSARNINPKPNALVATADVEKGNTLFCETLPLLSGTTAIEAYEGVNESQFPHSVIMLQEGTDGKKALAIGLIDHTVDGDPRSTFYMMNHAKYERDRNVRLPFRISRSERKANGNWITIEVCASKRIKKRDEIRFDYFSGDGRIRKEITWA